MRKHDPHPRIETRRTLRKIGRHGLAVLVADPWPEFRIEQYTAQWNPAFVLGVEKRTHGVRTVNDNSIRRRDSVQEHRRRSPILASIVEDLRDAGGGETNDRYDSTRHARLTGVERQALRRPA